MDAFVAALLLCLTAGLFLGLPWYFCAALSALAVALRIAVRKSRDPYGSFHLQLNVTDPAERGHPATEWLNMGYWKDAKSFPDACEALALKVIEAAGCVSGGRVLDVGHGSGDSLLLQLQHRSVPRPAELAGITSLEEHYERSCARTRAISCSTRVTLHWGDAVYRPDTASLDHPLAPSTSAPGYTSITAVDCAYHFRTRREFLRQCLARLIPGGRVALADICFDSDASSGADGWGARLVALLGVMPKENAVTKDEYVREMQAMGYTDVRLEDISQDVFPGFVRFLSSRGIVWGLFSRLILCLTGLGVRFVVVSGRKPL